MRIVIPGDPIANMRPRHKRVGGNMWTYDPQAKEKCRVKQLIKQETKNYDHQNKACKVDLEFQLDAFKGVSKSVANMRLWHGSAESICRNYRDLDNCEKFALDCGNGILWADDRDIVQLSSRKVYSKNTCTIINVEQIKEVKMSEANEKVFKTFSPSDCDEFAADAERIATTIYDYKLNDQTLRDAQMNAFAQLMIEFSDQWADKLKKIKGK